MHYAYLKTVLFKAAYGAPDNKPLPI